MSEQQRYWAELVEARYSVFYLLNYHQQYDRWQTRVNACLALVSSASIASWAVWKSNPQLWGALIALSQVVTAVRPWLPWERRLRSVGAAQRSFEELSLKAELKWFEVANGSLERGEIHAEVMELKTHCARILETHFPSPLPEDDNHRRRAVDRTREYFKNYGQG